MSLRGPSNSFGQRTSANTRTRGTQHLQKICKQRDVLQSPSIPVPEGHVSWRSTDGDRDYSTLPNGAPGLNTLNQVYGNNSTFVQIDHLARRKQRDAADITQAAIKLGMDKETVRQRLADLEALLPEIVNLDRMKASDWARVLLQVNSAAGVLIAIKTCFPSADVAHIMSRCPKMLLMDPAVVESDGRKVRAMLSSASDPDAIIGVVPQLLRPAALALALSNLRTWFKTDDVGAVAQLERTPDLLLNVEESNLEPDPSYGELTVAG